MKIIGHTKSGKPVYAAFQLHRSFADWTANDHHDAAEVHRDAARTDIKTNVSMHKNSATLHEKEVQRIYQLVEKLGLASPRRRLGHARRHPIRASRKSSAQLDREIAEAIADKPRSARRAHATRSKRVAYRIKLTPSEMRAVEFARGRYAWPDMLAVHAAEDGSVAFTENEMWQWTDDVDSDAEGGHSPFPLASDAFAAKLQRFYDERI